MTDEIFMRQWTDGHERFSADLDLTLNRLRRIIGVAYGEPLEKAAAASARPGPSNPAVNAMLAGLAATATTVVLLVSTIAVATPGVLFA